MRRRIVLTLLMLVIVGLALAVFVATQSVRNAPLTLGTGERTTPEATLEAEADGVPYAPPPYALAVNTNVAGNWDIVLLEPDGTQRNLTADNSGAHDYFPSFSLAGDMINFIASRGDAGALVPSQVRPNGEGLRSLSILSAVITLFGEGRLDWDPSWSPDGKRLLWSSLRDLNLELYVVEAGATLDIANATRLTRDGGRDWFGAWSPDGASIAFASDRDGNDNENLFIVPSAGGETVRLTDSPFDDIRAMWSADGTRIAYVHDLDDRALREGRMLIYVVPAEGGTPAPLEGVFISAPITSPDGAFIAYVSNESGKWQVLVANADGSAPRVVTPADGDYLFAVWKP